MSFTHLLPSRFTFHVLLIWFLAVHSLYALPESWTIEIPLSLGAGLAREPAICVRGQELFVAWSDNRLGGWEIFFRYSSDGGITWAPEERVTVTDGDSVEPAIACGRQSVNLVWLERHRVAERPSPQTEIRHAVWNGTAWSSPQTLSREDGSVRRPKIATTKIFPGGFVYVVWESNEGLRTTAYITRSGDGGRTWSRPQPITSGNWDTGEPDVAGGIRSAFVVWRDEREATSQSYVKRWDETTVSELFPRSGLERRLASIGNCRRPSIAVEEPRVFVTWECLLSDVSPANIFASKSTDRAETWTLGQPISADETESIAPQIVIRQDDAWLFWQNGTSAGNWEIHVARHQNEAWVPAAQFTESNTSNSTRPAIVAQSLDNVPEEQLHLVWIEQFNPDGSGIFYTRRDTIPPAPPNQPFHIDFDAPSGFDNDSRLTFSWETTGSREVEIQYHIFVSIDGGTFTEIGSTAENLFEFSAEDDNLYRVRLEASDAVGNRSQFSEISVPVFVDGHFPVVQIHLPLPDTVITQPIPVIASCRDTNLVECRLQFGPTIAPSVWTPLGPPIRIPFERERLIVWDTSNLDGVYTLALTAIDTAGNPSTTKIPVFIDNTPPLPLESGEGVRLIDENLEISFRMPAWSPDGQKIVFSSNEGGSVDIWALNVRDNTRLRLTRDAAIDLNPSWHPDSDRVVFQSQREGTWEIWTVRSNGSDHRALITAAVLQTNPQAPFPTSEEGEVREGFVTPVWSSKGSQLALAADFDGDLEIWVVRNADEVLLGLDADFFQLTRNTAQDLFPTWSPDETLLAFQSDRTGNWDIWRIAIDGDGEAQVYQNFANETLPKWSPNGKQILFLSDRVGNAQTVFNFNLLNGRTTEISPVGVTVDSANWSPDGRGLVYQSGDLLYTVALRFPEDRIEAKITRPFEGEQVQGKVDLLGLARGTQFGEYRLQYASKTEESEEDTKWHRIGGRSTAPVTQEGFLGQWDTQRLRGEFILRLVVVSTSGEEITDTITVSVQNERPRLEIFEPSDGLLTTSTLVTVRGQTEQQVTIVINVEQDETFPDVDAGGNFKTQLLLSEGTNEIKIQAINAIGLQTDVLRTVLRDSLPPKITLDSPPDFAIFDVPYVTVSGQVDDMVPQFSINDTGIPLQNDGHFGRVLSLAEGTNLIRVEAVDRLGRQTKEQRRVIYTKGNKADSPFIQKDTNPPAITDVLPPDGTVLTRSDAEIDATLVDDVEIDPLTIRFNFDGENFVFDGTEEALAFDGKEFNFNLDTGQFRYRPPLELVDGLHTFRLEVQDTAGNEAQPIDFEFIVDTQPFGAAITAKRADNILKVTLGTNKWLEAVPFVEVLPSGATLGYALNLDQFSEEKASDTAPTMFRYEGDFPLSPSQTGFTLFAMVRQSNGEQIPVIGYFTDENRYPNVPLVPFPQIVLGQTSLLTLSHLFIDDGPAVMFLQQSAAADVRVTLRSQGGLDGNLILAQRQNAADRGMVIRQPIYVIDADIGEKEIPFRIALPPPSDLSSDFLVGQFDQVALFQWEDRLQQWLSLDAFINPSGRIETVADRLGRYALLVDSQPPIIQSLFEDFAEVPLDRFLIEMEILDIGSGVNTVELRIDDQPAEFILKGTSAVENLNPEVVSTRLIYLPSNLDAGRHTLEVVAIDRAGNTAEHRQTFFTRDIFAFADEVVAYPSPASHEVTINFKLTKSADIELEIYDVIGELLYTDKLRDVTGQRQAFVWKCENRMGKSVSSGIYIYILEAKREGQTVRQSGKVAVVR
ncbi:PD40 domain-containing protein [Candidatus Poribacteria bacterium]|nr:PD40 domain-containing protein [Candidatus Poribacteria bacterium]